MDMIESMRDIEMMTGGFVFGVLCCLALLAFVRHHAPKGDDDIDRLGTSPQESPAAKVGHDRGIEVFDD